MSSGNTKDKTIKTYVVHVGVRMTYDVYVEAHDMDEAKDLGEQYAQEIPLEEWEYADTDSDAWVDNTIDIEDINISAEDY